jgi:hypothetical protein
MRPSIKEALDHWVVTGDRGGNFVMAVLENDLAGAVGRADDGNLVDLPEIMRYVYNNLPGACWGSKDRVKAWEEGMERGDPRLVRIAKSYEQTGSAG